MEEFLRKGTMINLVSTLTFLFIGIILVAVPEITLAIVSYAVEIVLIVVGIMTIINYLRVESKNDVFSLGFVQGVGCILLALFLIGHPKVIHTILPVVIGIWMVLGSLSRIQISIKLSAWGQKASITYIILAVLMFSVGLVVICNPFETAALIVQMLGIGMIVYSVFDIIESVVVINFLHSKINNK